ncbi:C-type lectin domain family 2 member B isoform X3 [Nycticebus coucang]|uniref:C-type lectin domain family 2 member B isoform X3 n=1 Tax=Nycticebus coucang TaxID=9470 RepID=UPI00234DC82D|nr:C-type lectin domain family 2 member B isoform X3 [Nycticebus coucang]
MTQSIQMKAFTERASSSETNGQGADKKKQGYCRLFMTTWHFIPGAMGRHKKTIATSAALVIIMVISVLVTKIAVQHPRSFCPDDWIGFQDKCYHFSEKEGDWESSRGNCSKEHADLTTIDNEKEMFRISEIQNWFYRAKVKVSAELPSECTRGESEAACTPRLTVTSCEPLCSSYLL